MKQVIQSARSGELKVKDVPAPQAAKGKILVHTQASLISAGTERMVVEFAKKNLAGKAKERPDLVKKVLSKAKTDGIKATIKAVMSRLDNPIPLGYSAAGIVVSVGSGLEGQFRVGERVAIAGAGIANHAEINAVPENLATPIPEGVSDEEAAFGTMGAIALHAVRNLDAKLGEVVAVLGAGLVGQMAAQFLSLSGVRAIVLDYDQARLDLAERLGAEKSFNLADDNIENNILALTGGIGCDGILIAAATDSSEPFQTAAAIGRDRARVCMVGLSGTEFPYAEFMKKEMSIIVSRSYGPGRYDEDYEGRGLKYPIGFVRWTETENLGEVMRLMAPETKHKLDVKSLITHHFDIGQAEDAFEMVLEKSEPHMGVMLTYPETITENPKQFPASSVTPGGCVLGVIGAGNFARAVLLPELKKMSGVALHTIATKRGASSDHAQDTFGFAHAATDEAAVLDNPDINAVLIATRHDSHAELTARALKAEKSVLVEKPLGLSRDEIAAVQDARETSSGFFQIGFNRRFAPLAQQASAALSKIEGPRFMVFRVNAGTIPGDSWIQNMEEGGGRIIGEMCHFVDLARSFAGGRIISVQADAAQNTTGSADDITALLRFENGSLATIAYTSLGDAAFPKERFEIFAGGSVINLDNFRNLSITSNGSTKNHSGSGQDKGFEKSLAAFVGAVTSGGPAPINENDLVESSLATLAVLDSLRSGSRIDL
ncbi:MAG: Gfo/Idh/MocA family oxidoreductase [Rhodospirillaceae bacterium]|nr:Gfo/Idh/MocA family oxidoreductase [Rhodospirillaceae bacterium]MBT7266042.1 Gfo/Idh/MocA family oxidoreductase [Rhodospirillaceae bacterium]